MRGARQSVPASTFRRVHAATRCPAAPAADRARGSAGHRAGAYSSSRAGPPTSSFHPTRHAGNLRVNLLRRHPVAIALVVLLLATAIHPLSPLVDAVPGSAPGDADLDRPILYVLFAPLSNSLDALTFFSQPRAEWALAVWILALGAWGALRRAGGGTTPLTWRRRVARALVGPGILILLGVAAVLLPRPVPSLTSDSVGTVIDYHAHTNLSHDGRPGWTLAKLAEWHAQQGFEASYVTDHNVVYDGSLPVPAGTSLRLLPRGQRRGPPPHPVA